LEAAAAPSAAGADVIAKDLFALQHNTTLLAFVIILGIIQPFAVC
jgi:hypothetical protein